MNTFISSYLVASNARRSVAWIVYILCLVTAIFGIGDYTFSDYAAAYVATFDATWQLAGLAIVAFLTGVLLKQPGIGLLVGSALIICCAVIGIYTMLDQLGFALLAYAGIGGFLGAYLASIVLRYETRAQREWRQATEWMDAHQDPFL